MIWLISKTKKAQPITSPKPNPTIEAKYQGSFGEIITSEANNLQFPEKLPLIETVNQTLTDSYVYNIASSLGFPETPQYTNDATRGKVWYWVDKKGSLFVFPEIRNVQYSSALPYNQAVGKQLSDVMLIEAARKFLLENSFLTDNEIGKPEITYLVRSTRYEGFDPGDRENALLFKVTFSLQKSDYSIFTQDNTEPTTTIVLFADGTVWSAQVTKFTFSNKTGKEIALKTYEEVLDSFAQKAVLMGVTNAEIMLRDISKDSLKNTSVKNIKLAYLLGSNQSTTLYPIFVITGESEVTGYPQKVKTIFYMYAEDK